MLQFLVRRALSSVGVVFGVATLVFVTVRAVPGDPVESILGEQALDVDKAGLRECLRLDEPLWRQYLLFLRDLVDGTLGRFCDDPSRTVRAEIVWNLWPTIELALWSLLLALLIAVPLGVLAALRHRTWIDVAALLVAMLGVSIPNFWLGPMLLILFSITITALPAPGAGALGFSALVLPVLTLSTALAAKLARMTRASMLDVLGQPYIQAARARGLRERVVVFRHALRNALTPVLSVLGLQLGSLLAGAIIVEKVFARPGLGTLLLSAIEMRNFALVQGCVIVIAAFYVLANLLTDIAYGIADPRLRQSGGDP
ncbi:MAG: ABC transporter permease [Deltaproteobacteria bacterium]|nr:MAG: ABC transporter permease [Deltaproteobacteria bacterium]